MSIFCWGSGGSGQIGTGDTKDVLLPTMLEAFKGKKVVEVSCGDSHTLATTDLGEVFVWGRGREGQHGDPSEFRKHHFISSPKAIKTLRHERIVRVASGYYHCLGLSATGKLYEWGKLHKFSDSRDKNYFGTSISLPGLQQMEILEQSHRAYYLGDMDSSDDQGCQEVKTAEDYQTKQALLNFGHFISYLQPFPTLVSGLGNKKVTTMAAGYSFTICCTEDGGVYGWGFNDKFQLGLGHRFNQDRPQLLSTLAGVNVVKVACGQQHSLALTAEGNIYSWGLSVFGQLGHGNKSDKARPTLIASIASIPMISIACGSQHSCSVSATGKVFSWGSSEYGQMGGGKNYTDWRTGERGSDSHTYYTSPQPMDDEAFDRKKVLDVSCGHLHNVAVTEDGLCYSWGWGVYGGLGHGDRKFQLVPRMVTKLLDMETSISKVAAGSKHTVTLNATSSTTFGFDFKPFINNSKFSDITFIVEGKRIYAHKAIISARCKFLQSMILMNDRFANRGNEIGLPKGIKFHLFLSLLFYLYTDQLRASFHLLADLGTLARRWQLSHLEVLCRRALINRGDPSGATIGDAEPEPLPKIPPSTFEADLLQIVTNPAHADITFKIPKASFGDDVVHLGSTGAGDIPEDYYHIPAHKVILCSRSDYFSTFFDSTLNGKSQSKQRKIEGIQLNTFLCLLRFIYGNETEFLSDPEMVVNMLIASDLFLLEDLKQLCEDVIERSLDVENCAWLLEISDQYNAPRLKQACLVMLKQNLNEIKTTEAFNQLKSSHHQLLREIDFEFSKEKITQPGELMKAIQSAPSTKKISPSSVASAAAAIASQFSWEGVEGVVAN